MTPKIERATMPIADLAPAPYNPRTISDAALAGLGASIARWGLVQPVVWNRRTGRVVGGHQRVKALAASGATEADVAVVDIDEIEEKALNVALNSPTIAGEFTEDLDALLREVAAKMPDVYAAVDLGGLEKIAAELAARAEQGGGEDPGAGEPPANPVSEPGEMFELGPHRLICGDSTDPEVVARVMAGERAVLMVTDPPYGVEYDATWRGEAGYATLGKNRTGKVENDDRFDWTDAYLLFPGAVAYVWHAGKMAGEVQRSIEAAGFVIRSQIVWNKTVMVMGRGDYHWKHEPCWYAVRKGASSEWTSGRDQVTVWDMASPLHIMSGSKEERTPHPTQKPVEAMERPIQNHAGNVYDPFLGSGTTLIAAARQKRRCFGIEISPAYCDVIRRRWTAYAKQAGIDPGTGALE